MARSNRTRSLDIASNSGSYDKYLYSYYQGRVTATGPALATTMYDTKGPINEDASLHQIKLYGEPYRLMGYYWSPSYRAYFNYPGYPGWDAGQSNNEFLWVANVPDWNLLASMARSRLNPNVPHVDLLVSIAELREIPKMIAWFRDLPRRGNVKTFLSEWWLTWNFGIRPILADLYGLSGLAQEVSRRAAFLQSASKQRQHVRKSLGSHFNIGFYIAPKYLWYYGSFSKGTRSFNASWDCWCTAQLKIEKDLSLLSDAEHEAFISALGIQPSIHSLWQLIPWSWLIDWFTNLGDILAQTRNRIPYKIHRLNLMAKLDGPVRHEITSGPSTVFMVPGDIRYQVFRRQPYAAPSFPTYKIPLLTLGQMGTLAALTNNFLSNGRKHGYR